MKHHPILYMDTMMEYHLSINPDDLDDDIWAIKFNQLSDIRKKEAEASKNET